MYDDGRRRDKLDIGFAEFTLLVSVSQQRKQLVNHLTHPVLHGFHEAQHEARDPARWRFVSDSELAGGFTCPATADAVPVAAFAALPARLRTWRRRLWGLEVSSSSSAHLTLVRCRPSARGAVCASGLFHPLAGHSSSRWQPYGACPTQALHR
jgi:hypothetical protein